MYSNNRQNIKVSFIVPSRHTNYRYSIEHFKQYFEFITFISLWNVWDPGFWKYYFSTKDTTILSSHTFCMYRAWTHVACERIPSYNAVRFCVNVCLRRVIVAYLNCLSFCGVLVVICFSLYLKLETINQNISWLTLMADSGFVEQQRRRSESVYFWQCFLFCGILSSTNLTFCIHSDCGTTILHIMKHWKESDKCLCGESLSNLH